MSNNRNTVLDLVRALAALAVMVSHVRPFFFVDYPEVPNPGVLTKLFYYVTGYGHQSVVVFFVLSGFLVGGSVVGAKKEGFWGNFLSKRLTRLWIVLVPCLLLTLVLNQIGQSTGGAAYLGGLMNPPMNSAPMQGGVRNDALTLLGNVAFLQTIVVPVFGDNGPLWSLASEFWYYLLFPLMYWGAQRRTPTAWQRRAMFIGIAAALMWWLPLPLLQGYLVWLFGVVVSLVNKNEKWAWLKRWPVGLVGALGAVVLFHQSRVAGGHSDIVLGAAFALLLPWVLTWRLDSLSGKVAIFFSDFSYTLYLCHFPLAAFLWYSFYNAQRIQPATAAYYRFGLVCAVSVALAYVLYWCFERNTERVRRWLIVSC